MGNQGGVYTFSQTAAANSTADATQNWAEGMAPSAINDSARALLASVAKYRDDLSGMLLTTGTSNAFILNSNQDFDSLADFHQKEIWFTPHVTNIAGSPDVSFTIDGFANIPIRTSPNTPLVGGVLIQGTPYGAIYNNTDKALYLKGFFGNPYNIPLGASLEYWLPTAPNSSFAFPVGQAISRTVFATLFGAMGTTFGAGDGVTTFNLPDIRGRVVGCMDAGRLADASSTLAGVRFTLGGAGGIIAHELSVSELASHAHGVTDPGHGHTVTPPGAISPNNAPTGVVVGVNPATGSVTLNTSTAATNISIQANGGNVSHENAQPTILANRILRII